MTQTSEFFTHRVLRKNSEVFFLFFFHHVKQVEQAF